MSERIFTVIEGADQGMTFVLGDRPVEIGRDPDRDVVLNDDRASRAHTRLVSEEGVVRLFDLESSNGTFVNGRLLTECDLNPGDVIAIGNTRIVYGTEAPPPPAHPAHVGVAELDGRKKRMDLSGSKTEILVGGEPMLTVRPVEAHFTGVMEAVVAFCRPLAESLGVFLSLETDGPSDLVSVDVRHAHRAVSGLINLFLTVYGETKATGVGEGDSTLALRLTRDRVSASVIVEMIWMGSLFPRDAVVGLDAGNAFEVAKTVANAHGGSFELFPAGSPETLARLRFPIGDARATRPTIIR